MLENASLMSENMNQSLPLCCRIFEAVGKCNALPRPSLRCIIVFRVQNAYVMYTVCVRSAILYAV